MTTKEKQTKLMRRYGIFSVVVALTALAGLGAANEVKATAKKSLNELPNPVEIIQYNSTRTTDREARKYLNQLYEFLKPYLGSLEEEAQKGGPQGPVGPAGPRGERGEKGEQGQRGEKGEQGQRGEKGEQGQRGEKGEQGQRGEKGEQGQRGEKGEQGKDTKPSAPKAPEQSPAPQAPKSLEQQSASPKVPAPKSAPSKSAAPTSKKAVLPATGEASHPFFSLAALSVIASAGLLTLKRKNN
ncbi:TPA: LPXTG cell wall anchor domain-containing protein [Streptococcus equi subsp. zooepidemicus]|nr:LPXTG cell wall anchor domain-containing protein [Streptococcus equi subsp. zooepidemicus]